MLTFRGHRSSDHLNLEFHILEIFRLKNLENRKDQLYYLFLTENQAKIHAEMVADDCRYGGAMIVIDFGGVFRFLKFKFYTKNGGGILSI